MKAMVLPEIVSLADVDAPLKKLDLPIPEPERDEVLIRVSACGVCHTEIDEIEGRAPPPRLPIILGHEVVGRIEHQGAGSSRKLRKGDRVGVGWIHSSCGGPDENISPEFRATGRDVNGGYAEYMTAPQDYVHAIPDVFSDSEAAPLLCAGSIGYRALRLSGVADGDRLGLTGFGASAHLVLPLAQHLFPGIGVYVFARNPVERAFALELGAVWAGDTADPAPRKLDAIIDTTPVWKPIVEALANLRPGGRLVINAIRKEEVDKGYLMNLSYQEHLWQEKEIKSVANITHQDIAEFLPLAAEIPIRPETEVYPLEKANQALMDLREGGIRGAKVLLVD